MNEIRDKVSTVLATLEAQQEQRRDEWTDLKDDLNKNYECLQSGVIAENQNLTKALTDFKRELKQNSERLDTCSDTVQEYCGKTVQSLSDLKEETQKQTTEWAGYKDELKLNFKILRSLLETENRKIAKDLKGLKQEDHEYSQKVSEALLSFEIEKEKQSAEFQVFKEEVLRTISREKLEEQISQLNKHLEEMKCTVNEHLLPRVTAIENKLARHPKVEAWLEEYGKGVHTSLTNQQPIITKDEK